MGRELLATNTFRASSGRPYVIDVYQEGRDIALLLYCTDEDLDEGRAHLVAMAKVLRARVPVRWLKELRAAPCTQKQSDAVLRHPRPR